MILEIKTADEFEACIIKNKKCVIDFWATWCAPCKAISEILESIEKSYPDVAFLKVNVETFPNISSRYFVTSLPALFFLKDAKVIKHIVGSVDKNKIRSILNQDLA